jgi:hypothetical protein
MGSKIERILGDKYLDNNLRNIYIAFFGVAALGLIADISGHGQYTTKLLEADALFAIGANVAEILGNKTYNLYGDLRPAISRT